MYDELFLGDLDLNIGASAYHAQSDQHVYMCTVFPSNRSGYRVIKVPVWCDWQLLSQRSIPVLPAVLSKPTFSLDGGTFTHKLLLLRLLVIQTADNRYIILHNDVT